MSGSVHGEVRVGDDGTPVAGALVRIAQMVDEREERSDPSDRPADERLARHLIADRSGWFAVDHLPEGDWLVEVEDTGGELIGHQEAPVFDDAVTYVAIDVEASFDEIVDRFASLRGRVVTADDLPVEGASVAVAADGGPDIAALTDQDGAFAFDGLPPGTWIVQASSLVGVGQTTVHLVAGTTVYATVEVRAAGRLP